MEKILSVIIPCYNSSGFIKKCLDSLCLDEVIDRLDIIVVNDGSTDDGASIVAGYCDRYPHSVRLISKENGGHGSAINVGSRAAVGRFLKVLDADDTFEKEGLVKFIGELEKVQSDVVLTFHHTIDMSSGELKNWKCFPPQFYKEYDMSYVMQNWKQFDRSLTFHGITYRTEFYQKNAVTLAEKVFYEDHEYATYPCCKAKSVLPMDIYLYRYRIGDVAQSVSQENQIRRLPHTETVLKKMTHEKKTVEGEAALSYCTKKIHLLLLSYLVTSLLWDKNRKAGRKNAKALMKFFAANDREVFEMSKNHYKILLFMNKLHISYKTYNRVLGSKIYNKLRKNRGFD